ncbi:MAG: hypothetical protein Q7R57_04500 [Dehalococcoidales bacterium]|nr:hypothetical protein [Dehalococcoidales bacterium]
MLKLSKTSWALLATGILVITFGSLGITRSQQLSEAKQLSDNLSVAQSRLNKLEMKDLYAQQDNLNAQINQISSDLQTDQAKLINPNDSITVVDSLFRIAGASGVEVVQIASSSLSNRSLEKVGFVTLPVSAIVKGEMPNLIDFVLRLNKDFFTGAINSGQIVVRGVIVSANATGNEANSLFGQGDILTVVSDNSTTATDNSTGAAPDTRSLAQVQMIIYRYQGN